MEICADYTHFNLDMKAILDNCIQFADNMTRMSSAMSILEAYHIVRDHNAMLMASAAEIRNQLNKCTMDCPDAPCIHEVAPFVLQMRDSLASFYTLAMQHPNLELVRKSTRIVFDIWDDLLDDCTVFQDHEVQSELNRLTDESKTLEPSVDWRKELYDM